MVVELLVLPCNTEDVKYLKSNVMFILVWCHYSEAFIFKNILLCDLFAFVNMKACSEMLSASKLFCTNSSLLHDDRKLGTLLEWMPSAFVMFLL